MYQPGDTIRASVAIKDISKLTEVSLGFVNDPDIGAPGISKFADMNKVIQHPNGHWLVPITLSIPLDSTASSYKFSHVSAIDEYGNSIGIIDDDNEISKFRDIRFAIKPLGVVQTDESLQNAPKPTQPKIEQLTIEPEQQGQKAPQQLTEPMNTEKETQDANKAKIEKSQQPVKQESQVQKTSQQATEIVDVSGALQVAKQSPNVPKFEQHIPTTKESMSETQERLLIDPMHRQSQQSGIEKRQKQFVIPPTEVVPVPSMMKQAQPMSSIKQTLFDSNQQKEDMTNNIKENKKVAKHSKLPQTGQHTYYSQIIIGGLLLIVSILLIVIVKRRLKQY